MKHTFESLMKRLSRAGFKKDFVEAAILPDWWDQDCPEDPTLLQDIEVRVARFLGSSLSVVRDVTTPLTPPAYSSAQLRKVRDVAAERLAPAIHSALRIAEAAARSLRDSVPERAQIPPPDGLAWRGEIAFAGSTPSLDDILDDLWSRGILVVPVDLLPAPSFQGIACFAEERPVILLGHKHDEPGRVAFLVAHETAHIASGDCKPGEPVVDEEAQVSDDSDIERKADRYARRVLVGEDSVPKLEAEDYRQLASRAAELERETGADASLIIFAWAAKTGDYERASMAVKALYRAVGARRKLQRHFAKHVDFAAANESDRALLRCVRGDSDIDESTY